MTSRIINMAERIKDAEDRLLESMFESTPIADDGFSALVVRRVRRRLWLRRLALPIAAALGGAIAIKPLTYLLSIVASLSTLVPRELIDSTISAIPQLPIIVLGGMVLVACLLGLQSLEE